MRPRHSVGKAFERFDCYPDAVLNVAIDLKSALPIGSALYDMIVPDIVGSGDIHLLVGQDLRAIEYFSTKLHTGATGYSPSMYNRTKEYGSWSLLRVLSDLSHGCYGMDSRSNHYELRKKQALQSSKLAVDGCW